MAKMVTTSDVFDINKRTGALILGNGYSGDLEIALIPEWFRTDILKEELDKNGVLVENSNITETEKFALPMHHDLWWKELFGCYYGGR